MLGSITPLGQRARGFRFWPTATAYIMASTLAATLVGATLGAIGASILAGVPVVAKLIVVAALAVIGLAMDLGWGGLRLPTVHRQVNEEWLSRYRGPIYGAGFGFQLGLGVITIVTTSLIYLTMAGAFLSGTIVAGAAIGFVFGLARALPILTVVTIRDPAQLRGIQASLARWRRPVRRAAYGLQSALVLAGGAAAVAVLR